jgi:hypothetical protein
MNETEKISRFRYAMPFLRDVGNGKSIHEVSFTNLRDADGCGLRDAGRKDFLDSAKRSTYSVMLYGWLADRGTLQKKRSANFQPIPK